MILVSINSGWHTQELATLMTADIDLEARTWKAAWKQTQERTVLYQSTLLSALSLKNPSHQKMNYCSMMIMATGNQHDLWQVPGPVRKSHETLEADPPTARNKTYFYHITKAKEWHVEEYILKLIVGHAITDITEKTYTHRTMEQLQKRYAR